MINLVREVNASNIATYHVVKELNTRYLNPEFYSKNQGGSLQWLAYEDNRSPNTFWEDNVLEFCLHSEVYKYLGLSYFDLMKLDLPTYIKIKEKVNAENKRKSDQLDQVKRDTQRRSDQLLGKLGKN